MPRNAMPLDRLALMRCRNRGRIAAVLAVVAAAAVLVPVAAHAAPSPDRPSRPSAAIVDGVVELSWGAPAQDAASVTGYQVLRRRPGVDAVGAFHVITDDTATTDTSFADVCARDAGASYTYRVKAWRDGELSGWSRYRRINLRDDFVAAEDSPDCDPDTGVITDSGDAGTDADDAQLLGIVAGTQGGAVVASAVVDTADTADTADSDTAVTVEDVCALAGTPAAEEQGSEESESGGVYRIAYTSPGDAFSIRVMDADGSNQTMVTSHSSDVHGTEWSPDSSKIAYYTEVTNADFELFVIGVDGSNSVRLTDDSYENRYPSWSPDGATILYQTERALGHPANIRSVEPDGANDAEFYTDSAREPRWSPDGTKVAFYARDYYVVDSAGENRVQINDTVTIDEHMAWSPDSTKIAYRNYGKIYVAGIDGSGSTEIAAGKHPVWSPDGTKILFWSDDQRELYTVEPDGTNRTRVTTNGRTEHAASWSPDGTKITYYAWGSHGGEIFVVDADGSNETKLTSDRNHNIDPVWSPDGTKIAFSSKSTDDEIFVINSDGTAKQRLTDNDVDDWTPAFSPDGTQIAYVTNDGDPEIAVMAADGTDVVQLTDNSTSESLPQWSPDGTQIAYKIDDGDAEIAVMAADGTGMVQLTDNSTHDTQFSWSPDSTKIIYTSNDGDNEISVIGADGTGMVQLTDNADLDEDPDWSPDGSRIAFTRMASPGDFEVFTANADGSCPKQMTNDPMHSYRPKWSPDGTRILFTNRLLWLQRPGILIADGTDDRTTQQQLLGMFLAAPNPTWSPDGTRLAYVQSGIGVMNATGNGIQRLTYSRDDRDPTWSPVPNSD
ncbi:DUF5050 domain-containing protein [Candidatus Poriferisodalis sp.]|uniref:DUF5050 domain-containing protein n=1 Tax=Candidatus Poriferisodalis sp. TaxID=3101277 RepID=UPI003B518AA4